MGDNIYLGDRNGVRTPMQWSADRNAGFLPSEPAKALSADHHRPGKPLRSGQRRSAAAKPELDPVVDEAADHCCASAITPSAGARTEFLYPNNRRVLVFIRRLDDEIILTVANLSRFVQCVQTRSFGV